MAGTKALKVGVTLAVVSAGVALMAYSISRSSAPYVKVDELTESPARWRGKEVWLGGRLVSRSLDSKEPAGAAAQPTHLFDLKWEGRSIRVTYTGKLPSGFRPGRQITVRGELDGSSIFRATEVTTRCPSKYRRRSNSSAGPPD